MSVSILATLLLLSACGGDDDDDGMLAVEDVRYTCLSPQSDAESPSYFTCRTTQSKQALPQQVDVEVDFRPERLVDLDEDEFRRVLDTLDESGDFVPILDDSTRLQLRQRGLELGFDAPSLDQRFRVPSTPDIPVCRYRGRIGVVPLISCR